MSRFARTLVFALVFSATSVRAQDTVPVITTEPVATSAPAPLRRLYLSYGTGVGGGISRYKNGRHGGGFAWGVHARVGFRLNERLALGGVVWLDPLWGARGESSSGREFSTPIALFLWLGPSLSVTGDSHTTTIGLLGGGGATLGTGAPAYGFGGAGVMLTSEVSFWLADTTLGRIGPFGRVGLAALFDPGVPNVFEGYITINVGVAIELE